ncbi:hypothetical protein H4R18_002595 [Coemansia javaensis]|uniref:Methylmalonic aciduria and homocystinuria type D protein n=1 Tax=Coemansia javaensis TaxID=2761396 RepID=A0A9W8HH44_9FUNG|nr:hypothetical protein H4R18_002595 [Coemansia javaensis]
MPSTVAVAAAARGPAGAPHRDPAADKGSAGRRRASAVVDPVVATFRLPRRLPEALERLRVRIDTDEPRVVLQYSVHTCPRRMRREIGLVFPEVAGVESRLLIIPTFQKTQSSMVSYHPDTQAEKDAKLHLFYRWGAELVARLRARGHWADVTDPMSGMALFTACGPSLYPDVEGAEVLLRYTPFNLGNCFVLSHPHWGTHIYPATAFTLAPADVVAEALAAMARA